MKIRNYEKKTFILSIIMLLLAIEMILFLELNNRKLDQFQNYTMIKMDNQKGYILVSKQEKKMIYQNRQFYRENKKQKYTIMEENLLEEDIYQMILETSNKKDMEEITFRTHKISLMEMIKNTWGGDNNGESGRTTIRTN